MTHGNYRRLHYTEAISDAHERDEILVGLDEVLMVNQGTEAVVAIHIVAEPQFWEHDEPKGYGVQLVRPRWLYGSEGHLFPLRWVGHINELSDSEIDALTDTHPYITELPEASSFLWAMPRLTHGSNPKAWQRCELNWWEMFRTPLSRVELT